MASVTQGKGKFIVLSTAGQLGVLVVPGAHGISFESELVWRQKEGRGVQRNTEEQGNIPFLPQLLILH